MNIAAFDVSKKTLEVSSDGRIGCLPNEEEAIRSYLASLSKETMLAAEATGRHHQKLVDIGYEMGFTVFVANPKRVRHYAKSESHRGKTDRLDAQTLEAFVKDKHERLWPYSPADEIVEKTRTLVTRRSALTSARAMVEMSLRNCELLAEESNLALSGLDSALKGTDKKLKQFLKGQESYELLQTIPGVGPICAAGFFYVLNRCKLVSSDAFVAYLGLDPKPNDSGARTGRRYISSQGDAEVRRLAYLAAMSACRKEPFKTYYELQKAKGLPSIAALVVLARKLARVAYSVHKSGKPYEPV